MDLFTDEDHLSLGYCNECLYVGVNNKIYIYQLNLEDNQIKEGEAKIITDYFKNEKKPIMIDLGVKLHGFLVSKVKLANKFLVLCSETNDN